MFDLEKAWSEISKGDAEAADLLRTLYAHFHLQDDLIDKDKEVTPAQAVASDLRLISIIGTNNFYKKHSAFLWPVFVMAGLAFVASEEFKKRGDVIDRIASQVLKSQYVDIFLAIAFLTGGYEHALEMGRRYRDYHYDAV